MKSEPAGAKERPAPAAYEDARLAALSGYQILDTDRDIVFDRLTGEAAQIFRVPVAGIVFLDVDRLWFKAQIGLDLHGHPGRIGSCVHAILSPDVVVLEDTAREARRVLGSFVPSQPFYRFYAGAPLFAPGGVRLGTVCVLDYQPRSITANQVAQLKSLAGDVMLALERRRRLRCRPGRSVLAV